MVFNNNEKLSNIYLLEYNDKEIIFYGASIFRGEENRDAFWREEKPIHRLIEFIDTICNFHGLTDIEKLEFAYKIYNEL